MGQRAVAFVAMISCPANCKICAILMSACVGIYVFPLCLIPRETYAEVKTSKIIRPVNGISFIVAIGQKTPWRKPPADAIRNR